MTLRRIEKKAEPTPQQQEKVEPESDTQTPTPAGGQLPTKSIALTAAASDPYEKMVESLRPLGERKQR